MSSYFFKILFCTLETLLVRDYRKVAVNRALKKQEQVICAFYIYCPHMY